MSGLVAYRNLFDELTLEVGPSSLHNMGIEEVPGFAISNLKTRQLSSVARYRSNDADPGNWCALHFEVPSAKKANMVAIMGRDAPAYITATGTLDSGSVPGSPVYIAGQQPALPQLAIYAIPPSFGDLTMVVLEHLANVPAPDYLELSRIYVANAIVLPTGVEAQWSLGVDDPGTLDLSAGRQWYESTLPRTRRLSVLITGIDSTIAFGIADDATSEPVSPVASFQDMQMAAGATGEVIVVPHTRSQVWVKRLGIYGHLERPPVIRHRAGPLFESELTVIEER